MIRVLPFAVELVLVVFCLFDCMRAETSRIRNLPRWAWVLGMLVIPILGCLAWLIAGRPTGSAEEPPPPTGPTTYQQPPRQRTIAPDDDPEFLRSLKRSAEHEALLKKWEEDLKRREDELRKQQDDGPDPS
ncbi:MAG: PLD nuclease N-terminal domain-containing protein [Propionicimonas sp.]